MAFLHGSKRSEKEWTLSVTARAPSNIAVIKYWGKRDELRILPINSSLSVTLDPEHLSATTTVSVSPSFTEDKFWLNGSEIDISGRRYQNCLTEIRSRAEDVSDENSKIRILKEEWKVLHIHVASENNFPTAAGLASSAAGFACFVYALSKLMGFKEAYPGELSTIARVGSGSACRSLYGGFVKWNMGKEMDGSDCFAEQIIDDEHWKDLKIIVAVVNDKKKETGSTIGMENSVKTSPLLHYRAKEVVPKRMIEMEDAILSKTFSSFSRLACSDSNQFHATCLDTSPPIFYLNETSHKLISMIEKWNVYAGSPQAAYTFDAGPNAVFFVPEQNLNSFFTRLFYYFPPPNGSSIDNYIVGDRSTFTSAGFTNLDDPSLSIPPPEVSNLKQSRLDFSTGELKYLICTQPGKGPRCLTEASSLLLDPLTGLPRHNSK